MATCAIAGIVTLVILLIALASNQIYPFGDKSLAIYDLEWQYQSYFGWLSNVLHGQSSLFYSAAKGLGGGMFTLFAYYLSSPFNVLAFFFSPEQTPELIVVLTLLKIPTCAITCAVFLTGRFADHINAIPDHLVIVLASVSYALCGCIGGYSSNLMWIDGYYMLPIVALGVYRLVSQRKVGLLFGSVVCSVLFNWYTAYMNCLFAILYFAFELMRRNAWSLRVNKKELVRICTRFACVMALAIGTSMVLLWPNIVEQMQGKGSNAGLGALFTQPLLSAESYAMWGQFCIGSSPKDEGMFAPVYISSFVILLVLAFMFMRGYRKSDRKAYIAMCVVAVLSTVSPFLNTIWTGFFPTSSYINRQTYVFSFFLAVMAVDGWTVLRHADRSNVRHAILIAAVAEVAVIGASIVVTRWRMPVVAAPWQHYVITIVVIAVCALFVYFFGNLYAKIQDIAQRQLADIERGIESARASIETRSVARRTVCIMCIGLVAFVGIETMQSRGYFASQNASASYYERYMVQMSDALASLEGDNGFLRIEQTGMSHFSQISMGFHDFTNESANNDALALNVSSLMHYSSTQSNNEQDFFARVGYTKQSIFGTYARSPIEPVDKLLGVQYVIDNRDVPGATKVDADLPQPNDSNATSFSLYRYDQTMPLGYGVASDADLGWLQKDTRIIADPFADQESLFGALTGEDATGLYHRDAVDRTEADGDHRSYDVTVTQSGPAYLKLASNMNPAHYDGGIMTNVYVNGQQVRCSGGRFGCGIVYLGTFNRGDVVHLRLDVPHKTQGIDQETYSGLERDWFTSVDDSDLVNIQSLDQQTMDDLLGSLDSQDVRLNSFTDRDIDMTVNAKDDELFMLTIPYDMGWNATVDGEDASVETVANTFCGVNVHQGENNIHLHYHTPGLYTGATIAGVSLLIYVVWQICATLRRRKERLTVRRI